MHKLTAIIFAIVGTVSLLFAFYNGELKWFSFAAAILFFTKCVRSFLIGSHAKTAASEKGILTAKDWRIIMSGYLTSTLLFLISGLTREGWLGFVAAPVLLFSSFTFWLIAKKTENLQKETGA